MAQNSLISFCIIRCHITKLSAELENTWDQFYSQTLLSSELPILSEEYKIQNCGIHIAFSVGISSVARDRANEKRGASGHTVEIVLSDKTTNGEYEKGVRHIIYQTD